MGDLLKNTNLDKQLSDNGYTTFEFLDSEEVRNLYDFYIDHLPDKELDGFHVTMFNESVAYRKLMDEAIRNAFTVKLAPMMEEGYEMLYSNFMVKEKASASEMPIHQDWSYVEEPGFSSFAIWVPLVDLTENNGVFCVMPGSHKMDNYVRGPGLQCPFEKNWRKVQDQILKPLYLKAGQAVIWNHLVAHYSPANQSETPRIAATAIIVPKRAKVYHFFKADGLKEVEQFEVDRDFYMSYSISKRPDAEKVGSLRSGTRSLSADELIKITRE